MRAVNSVKRPQKGFTFIEVLVTAFVLATIVVTVTGLALIITRSAIEAERKNIAQSIANEEMEIARTYAYAQIEYRDANPAGKIERTKSVERNGQLYTATSLITYVDDPLTKETQDFKQLTIRVSWPRMRSGVVLSSFFTKGSYQQSEVCIPGTITCPSSSGPPVPFQMCPKSGKCSDIKNFPSPVIIPTPTPSRDSRSCREDSQCQTGEACFNNTCQPAWCEIIQTAPLVDSGACEGQFVIEDCTATCPSYRRLGELSKVPICGRDAYCVITNYTFERCPDPAICRRKNVPRQEAF